ncbi:acetyltransferase [Holophaga foetida]|uniref:acetyltransferase n=1 Tax=Holophaga foetida TaxID=35839 RepID=UPI0002474D14|nr:acetyltransferase [Holophaga foetida]
MPETQDVIIVGAGGFGREVHQYLLDALQSRPGYRFKGFLDDDPDTAGTLPGNQLLLGDILDHVPHVKEQFVVAIGDPEPRARIIRILAGRGARFFTLIHPSAYVASTADIGAGCIVCPFCSIGNGASIADHVVLTWYSSVAHDARAESFSVLSPYSTINGGAVLGEGAFLGAHAVVNPLQTIGAWAKVGAGAVVYRSVPPQSLAMGNPARTAPLMREESQGT